MIEPSNIPEEMQLDSKSLVHIFQYLGDLIGIDPNQVKSMKSALSSAQESFFPIRHHSPASSRYLLDFLKKKPPKLVFLEFPVDVQEELPFIIESDTIPPLAVYSFFKDDHNQLGLNGIFTPNPQIPKKFHAWYPLTQYSPEYVLLAYCKTHGIPVFCIDAPFISIIERQIKQIGPSTTNAVQKYIEPLNEFDAAKSSAFFDQISNYFGNQSMDDIWDLIFEIPGQISSVEEYLEVFMEYCINLRLSTPEKILKQEVILFRENFMSSTIAKIRKKYPKIQAKDVLIITGGLHAVSLPSTMQKPVKIPKYSLQSITSLIPFSYSRISNLSGYSSGNWAPFFYDQVWEKYIESVDSNGSGGFGNSDNSDNSDDSKVSHFYEKAYSEAISTIFHEGRGSGMMLSTADSIAVHQTSRLLASLRFRSFPNVRDIQEALVLCCIKENPATSNLDFQNLIMSYFIGTKIGKISTKYTMVGLQKDFYLKFENFDITLDETQQQIELNLHKSHDRLISTFFWQLDFLELPGFSNFYGNRELHSNTDIFKEKWDLRWTPQIDLALLDKAIYGTTIEECVLNILNEKMSIFQNHVAKNAHFLYLSLKMGLSSQIGPLTKRVQQSVTLDQNFFHLGEAFFTILLIQKVASTIPYTSKLPLNQLIQAHFYSICSELLNNTNPKEEEEEKFVAMVHQITDIVLTNFTLGLNTSVYDSSLVTGYHYSNSYYIKGTLLGARYLLQTQTILQIKQEIENIFNSMFQVKLKFGRLIFGIVTICKNQILFEKDFIQMLVDIIDSIEWEHFLIILPGIRKAFTLLSQRDHENISKKIAGLLGVQKEEVIAEVLITQAIQNSIKKIDARVSEILEKWMM